MKFISGFGYLGWMLLIIMYVMFSAGAGAAASSDDAEIVEIKQNVTSEFSEAEQGVMDNLTGHSSVFKPMYANLFETSESAVISGLNFGQENPGLAQLNMRVGSVMMVLAVFAVIYMQIRRVA